jgi:hypothetical protein
MNERTDAERLDWLERQTQRGALWLVRHPTYPSSARELALAHGFFGMRSLRRVIDEAMAQDGLSHAGQ